MAERLTPSASDAPNRRLNHDKWTPAVTKLLPILILLMVHFFIRSHNITVQDAYIDEGFHLTRADEVWDFEVPLGDYGYGKILLYYWFGLFEDTPSVFLFSARLGMAIFSLMTGAVIYQLAKLLGNHATGLIALTLYALMPYAVFYERMAMADPIAAFFVGLVAWTSLIYARRHDGSMRSTLRYGFQFGVLIGLMMLGKLTVTFIALLPGITALIFSPTKALDRWVMKFIPPLMIAAVIVILIWLPLVIPAYLNRNSEDAVVAVDSTARRTEGTATRTWDYAQGVLPITNEFTHADLMRLFGVGLAVLGILSIIHREWKNLKILLFGLSWIALIALLPIFTANLLTTRYFMPTMMPLVIFLAFSVTSLWKIDAFGKIFSAGMMIGLVVWAVGFALPFIQTDLTDPYDLPFTDVTYTEHQAGYFLADDAVRNAANDLNELNLDDDTHIYAPWNICHLIYFHIEYEMSCLEKDRPVGYIFEHLPQELDAGDIAYVVMADFSEMFFLRIEGLSGRLISEYQRERIRRPVSVWQIWWSDSLSEPLN